MNETVDKAWVDEMVRRGAPKTEREKKIAEKVIEIEARWMRRGAWYAEIYGWK